MIRVLHVVSSIGNGSGVASVIMSYYRAINRDEIQFDFLSFKKKEQSFEDEIKKLGGNVYYCSKPSFSKKFHNEMKDFFKEHSNEYQIMHCHPIFAPAIFGLYAKKYGIKNIIAHSHTTKFSDNKLSAIRNMLILSLFGRGATHYMACSEDAKKIFYWKNKKDIYLLKNGVDMDKFKFSLSARSKIRNHLNVNENETVIGHIGRFTASKNHKFILNTFKKYKKNNPDSKLLLLGDGDMFEQIVDEASKLELNDSIIFTGRQDNVAEYLSAMDLFIFPSTFEGLGIVLIEAQLNGLPCLTSTNVPKEADITGNVRYENLKSGVEHWNQVLTNMQINLEDRNNVILINNDYDIKKCSKSLENYYRGLF